MDKETSLKPVVIAFGILIIAFLAAFYVIAWQEPTQTPPQGNAAPPINTSTAPQAKSGILSVTQLNDTDNPSYYLNPSGSSNLSGSLILGGTISASNYPPDSCSAGSAIRTVNADGTVVCEADNDTYFPSGLYGWCRQSLYGQGECAETKFPAVCVPNGLSQMCGCSEGYISVKFGCAELYEWYGQTNCGEMIYACYKP